MCSEESRSRSQSHNKTHLFCTDIGSEMALYIFEMLVSFFIIQGRTQRRDGEVEGEGQDRRRQDVNSGSATPKDKKW